MFGILAAAFLEVDKVCGDVNALLLAIMSRERRTKQNFGSNLIHFITIKHDMGKQEVSEYFTEVVLAY